MDYAETIFDRVVGVAWSDMEGEEGQPTVVSSTCEWVLVSSQSTSSRSIPPDNSFSSTGSILTYGKQVLTTYSDGHSVGGIAQTAKVHVGVGHYDFTNEQGYGTKGTKTVTFNPSTGLATAEITTSTFNQDGSGDSSSGKLHYYQFTPCN